MKYKVVLYNPQAVFYTMPLALLAVGSHLDPGKYEVRVIDGRIEKDPAGTVAAEVPDALCLGITVLTGTPINDALEITRAARARRPDICIVWGGWHPSLFPMETLAESGTDVVVQGQGEVTFAHLVALLADGEDVSGLPGTATRINGRTQVNETRPLVDMNSFSLRNYDLISVERYFQMKGERQLDYVSSTGCFYRCAFCADPFVYNRHFTSLAPERVGEEVEFLWRRFRFTDLAFQDESFFTRRESTVSVAEEFLHRGLRFTWTATMRADHGARMPDNVFATCVRSGLRRVMIGVESGSQEMLDWIDKDVTVEQVLDCADKCARHSIGAIFPFIVGFPDETEAHVRATMSLIKQLRAMSPRFETPIFYFKPYPGSRIAVEMTRNGLRMPTTLAEWAQFDYIGSSGPWVSAEKHRLVERFKFFSRLAWGSEHWLRAPLQKVARWRCAHDFYQLPIEKAVVERIRPLPQLS